MMELGEQEEFPGARKHLIESALVGSQVFMATFISWNVGVGALCRTLGPAVSFRLGRLFGMCLLPSRATFGLTCCLPSSSSPSASLGSLHQCQEIVGQR